MKTRGLLPFLIIAVMVLGCLSGYSSGFAYSDRIIVGKITAIDGQNITVLIGELTDATPGNPVEDQNGVPPELPDGDAPVPSH